MYRARKLRFAQTLLAGVILGMMLLTSACGGDSHLQQQASQAHTQLDQQIQHARSIGVPDSALQPLVQQEQKLNGTSAPFSWFNDTPDNAYYTNQAHSYQQLITKLQQTVSITTGQDQGLAQQALQNFQQALTTQQAKKYGNLQAFAQQYSAQQNLMTVAQTPNDYLAIRTRAIESTSTLGLMVSTYQQLTIFKTTLTQMKQARIDVTAL